MRRNGALTYRDERICASPSLVLAQAIAAGTRHLISATFMASFTTRHEAIA
jgi:hypothetical protein